MKSNVAVVILNWNGEELLKKFLPGIVKYSEQAKIYVVDNNSSDRSETVVQSFPAVKWIKHSSNLGFAGGYNEGLRQIDADYYVLLNSDVEVKSDWISPVVRLMESDRQIGACQPKIKDQKNPNLYEYAGAAGGFIDKFGFTFCRGRIFNSNEEDVGQYNESSEIFWASGAAMFVRADLFNKLGGLDEDFFAHMEEIDLCWRLKNAGYKIWYCAESEVYHIGGATLNKMSSHKTFLNFRNNLYLLIKNDYRKNWWYYMLIRLILDGVASFRFLFLREFSNVGAVLKAHFSVYADFFKLMKKRKKLKSNSSYSTDQSKFFVPVCSVYRYFILKKTTWISLMESAK